MGYLGQRAAPWVSVVVMAGGLLTAISLVFLFKFETSALLVPNSSF